MKDVLLFLLKIHFPVFLLVQLIFVQEFEPSELYYFLILNATAVLAIVCGLFFINVNVAFSKQPLVTAFKFIFYTVGIVVFMNVLMQVIKLDFTITQLTAVAYVALVFQVMTFEARRRLVFYQIMDKRLRHVPNVVLESPFSRLGWYIAISIGASTTAYIFFGNVISYEAAFFSVFYINIGLLWFESCYFLVTKNIIHSHQRVIFLLVTIFIFAPLLALLAVTNIAL